MRKFITDILKEANVDKYSSKKIAGVIGFILLSIAFVVDGLDFYQVNNHLFDSMLIFSGAMLGLPNINTIIKAKKDEQN